MVTIMTFFFLHKRISKTDQHNLDVILESEAKIKKLLAVLIEKIKEQYFPHGQAVSPASVLGFINMLHLLSQKAGWDVLDKAALYGTGNHKQYILRDNENTTFKRLLHDAIDEVKNVDRALEGTPNQILETFLNSDAIIENKPALLTEILLWQHPPLKGTRLNLNVASHYLESLNGSAVACEEKFGPLLFGGNQNAFADLIKCLENIIRKEKSASDLDVHINPIISKIESLKDVDSVASFYGVLNAIQDSFTVLNLTAMYGGKDYQSEVQKALYKSVCEIIRNAPENAVGRLIVGLHSIVNQEIEQKTGLDSIGGASSSSVPYEARAFACACAR